MSTTYLTLANNVLQELNDVALTSSNFSSSRGIQTSIKKFVNKAIHDIYNEAGEIPASSYDCICKHYTGCSRICIRIRYA